MTAGGVDVVLIATSPRVAPGLLAWPAWAALREAALVLTRPDNPQTPAVRDAGVPVGETDEPATVVATRLLAAPGRAVWLGTPEGDDDVAAALSRALGAAAVGGTTIGAGVPAAVDLAPGGVGSSGTGSGTGSPGSPGPATVEVLLGSYDVPGSRLLDVVAVMDRLRSPGGCPWDREQTHASLARYLLEEAYETVDAIERDDADHLAEELGDVLLQVVFHARVAAERGRPGDDAGGFDIDDVAGALVDKLVRRHPHVFGDATADTAAHVEAAWDRLKAAEKQRTSAIDGVPMGQPALALAAALVRRADRAGLAGAVAAAPPEPAESAVPASNAAESAAAGTRPGSVLPQAALGDALLSLAAVAQRSGVDPEAALRAAARRYAARIVEAERLLAAAR